SNNLPVIAHAIALWRTPGEYAQSENAGDPVTWWQRYLDCQSGERCVETEFVPCPPGQTTCNKERPFLDKWKGAETFSNTYDAITTTSVIAVHFWANRKLASIPATHPDYTRIADLDTKAR